MSADTDHSEPRPSPMRQFVIFRLTITSAAMAMMLIGAVFLVPALQASYQGMGAELPPLSVAVFRVFAAARTMPWLSVAAGVVILGAATVLPALLPSPLGTLVRVLMFFALLATVLVVVAAMFWPYVTTMRSLTDSMTAPPGR